jgi:hypothetical protein
MSETPLLVLPYAWRTPWAVDQGAEKGAAGLWRALARGCKLQSARR